MVSTLLGRRYMGNGCAVVNAQLTVATIQPGINALRGVGAAGIAGIFPVRSATADGAGLRCAQCRSASGVNQLETFLARPPRASGFAPAWPPRGIAALSQPAHVEIQHLTPFQ